MTKFKHCVANSVSPNEMAHLAPTSLNKMAEHIAFGLFVHPFVCRVFFMSAR